MTLERVGVSMTPDTLYTPGKDPVPSCKSTETVQTVKVSRDLVLLYLDHGNKTLGASMTSGRSLFLRKNRYPLVQGLRVCSGRKVE
jgi:hypothetical protein